MRHGGPQRLYLGEARRGGVALLGQLGLALLEIRAQPLDLLRVLVDGLPRLGEGDLARGGESALVLELLLAFRHAGTELLDLLLMRGEGLAVGGKGRRALLQLLEQLLD